MLYADTHYGHLFKCEDPEESWHEVAGAFAMPKINECAVDWRLGMLGLCIHMISMDANQEYRFYIVSSGGKPYITDEVGLDRILLDNGAKTHVSIPI